MGHFKNFGTGGLSRSFKILSRVDRKKLLIIAIAQICLGFFDLFGMALIGLLGALSMSGITSQDPSDRILDTLSLLKISELSFQSQVAILGISAFFLLVLKSILSIYFTRRIMIFMSRKGAAISADLISRLLAQPLLVIQGRTTQATLYAVTRGVEIVALQILATSVVIVADIALLIFIFVALLLLSPTTAISTFFMFSVVGLVMYKLTHLRASTLGQQNSHLNIKSEEKIVEVFNSYREAVVQNRRDYYAREIQKVRFKLADISAELTFLPYVSKYVIEACIILGALVVASLELIFSDTVQAVSTLAIFLAAGTRIAPAILRAQQGAILVKASLGQAEPTLELIETLGQAPPIDKVTDSVDFIHAGFQASIEIQNTSLAFSKESERVLDDISLTIPPGAFVGIVGPSGAGKTSLIDVLLGILIPDSGQVLISKHSPLTAIATWPGAISYVPQEVFIAAGSIRENVALGYPLDFATDENISETLRISQLQDFVSSLPNGLETQVGERGTKLSGGQRQRLGIARAMFTRPQLLILDEATSSLDSETEDNISQSLQSLKGSTTVVMIAHRLSIIRNADIVIYLSEGRIRAMGTFDEVRQAIPDFDRQASLMGL